MCVFTNWWFYPGVYLCVGVLQPYPSLHRKGCESRFCRSKSAFHHNGHLPLGIWWDWSLMPGVASRIPTGGEDSWAHRAFWTWCLFFVIWPIHPLHEFWVCSGLLRDHPRRCVWEAKSSIGWEVRKEFPRWVGCASVWLLHRSPFDLRRGRHPANLDMRIRFWFVFR